MHNHNTLGVKLGFTCITYYREEASKFKDIVNNYNHCVVIFICVYHVLNMAYMVCYIYIYLHYI